MNSHKYILEPYSGVKSRWRCPACNNMEKTFSRYIDTETGEYLADHVGRCNREDKCGYHYTPKQYFIDNNRERVSKYAGAYPVRGIRRVTQNTYSTQGTHSTQETETPPSFIDVDIFNQSLSHYDRNTFTGYLTGLFGEETVRQIIDRYKIGTSKHWPGATIFWQIDTASNIRAGKIMLYNEGGHRIKDPFNHITWVHKALYIEPYNLKQCLFGEHLLPGNTLPVAIVESEKTACIASIYLPQFLWLACGQLQGLTAEKCKVLSGKAAILFPDLKGYDKWQAKAKQLESRLPGTRFIVSDYLEKNAPETDKAEGYDLADYLIRFDVSDFAPDVPRWYVNMQGILRQYEAGEITGDEFLKLQDENWNQSGLTGPEYVRQVNKFSISKN